MGVAKRRARAIDRCIYCGSRDQLSDEHVVPFALGGTLVLSRASCESCRVKTGSIEQRLLRNHWWPYRQRLRLPTRRPVEQPTHVPVKLFHPSREPVDALLPVDQHNVFLVFQFDPPSILQGRVRPEVPFGRNVLLKPVGEPPRFVEIDGQRHSIGPEERVEIPVNLDAADVTRFLAKVAHGYAISRRGLQACAEYYLSPIILGGGEGALTYIGNSAPSILGPRLPGSTLHALLDRVNGEYLTVLIQLFRDQGDPPPIYEVVVGRCLGSPATEVRV